MLASLSNHSAAKVVSNAIFISSRSSSLAVQHLQCKRRKCLQQSLIAYYSNSRRCFNDQKHCMSTQTMSEPLNDAARNHHTMLILGKPGGGKGTISGKILKAS